MFLNPIFFLTLHLMTFVKFCKSHSDCFISFCALLTAWWVFVCVADDVVSLNWTATGGKEVRYRVQF